MRSMSQERLVPEPVAVLLWPGVKVVPKAGVLIAVAVGAVPARLTV